MTIYFDARFLNTLGLRVFRRHDTPRQSRSALDLFERDPRSGVSRLMPLHDNIFLRATELSRDTTARLGTRASDSLHVAAALDLGADLFYTFDRQQAKLAKEMKLQTNPIS